MMVMLNPLLPFIHNAIDKIISFVAIRNITILTSHGMTGPNINWDTEEEVPAHLLLFIDLSENFSTKFDVGPNKVMEAGYYAIAHTFEETVTVPGHLISKLVWYGELVGGADPCNKGQLCSQLVVFSCDSSSGPCVAAPYVPKENIIEATKWLILKPRSEWYVLFLEYMRERNKKF
jgi:hypothetical protein